MKKLRELNIPDYEKWTIFSLTQLFYSAVDPDEDCDPVELFTVLTESLKALQIEFQVDEEKLALKYTGIGDEEEGDGDEKMEANDEELHLMKVECSFTVCVTVCKKEVGKYCLDFILMKGDRGAFIEHYELLQEEYLWPYNNATI